MDGRESVWLADGPTLSLLLLTLSCKWTLGSFVYSGEDGGLVLCF